MSECFCLLVQIIIISYIWLTYNLFSLILIMCVDEVKLPSEGQFEAFGNLSHTTFSNWSFSFTLTSGIAHLVFFFLKNLF